MSKLRFENLGLFDRDKYKYKFAFLALCLTVLRWSLAGATPSIFLCCQGCSKLFFTSSQVLPVLSRKISTTQIIASNCAHLKHIPQTCFIATESWSLEAFLSILVTRTYRYCIMLDDIQTSS